MSIDTYEGKKWANTGTKEADVTFDEETESGFEDELVRYDRLNKILNRQDIVGNDAANRQLFFIRCLTVKSYRYRR